MGRSDDLYVLPDSLPAAVDDGACDHLVGMSVPPLSLRSTGSRWVRLDAASADHRTVVFCYPRTGTPDRDPPPGWNDIPGARGCTPQCLAYRDLAAWFRGRQIEVFGLSTQTTEYQQEMARRLDLPYEVLSDHTLELTRALRLPTFTVGAMTLVKRLTLVLRGGVVEHVFYPVFPPDGDAQVVADWIAEDGRWERR